MFCVGGLESISVSLHITHIVIYISVQSLCVRCMLCNSIQFNSFALPLFSLNNYLDTIYDLKYNRSKETHFDVQWKITLKQWKIALFVFFCQCHSVSFALTLFSTGSSLFLFFFSDKKRNGLRKKSIKRMNFGVQLNFVVCFFLYFVCVWDDFHSCSSFWLSRTSM